MNIKDDLFSFNKDFSNYLLKIFNNNNFTNLKFLEAISYSVLAESKKIRPFIIFYLGSLLKIKKDTLFSVGLAIEMIHTYTLVHDDLPSMDNDNYRRGQLSSHKKYNEATAILVGDALLSDAFFYLSKQDLDISDKVKIKIINKVSNYIGSNNLILGQFLDINFKKSDSINNIEEILKINLYKTAKLFSLCAIIPAIISGLSENKINKCALWGEAVGFIFQMIDDIKDKEDGKPNIFNILGEKDFYELLNEKILLCKNIANDLGLESLNQILNLITNKGE